MFCVNFVFEISLDIFDKVRLFDIMVQLLLCYQSEVWGFHNAAGINVYRLFMKQLLFVRPHTSNVCSIVKLVIFCYVLSSV